MRGTPLTTDVCMWGGHVYPGRKQQLALRHVTFGLFWIAMSGFNVSLSEMPVSIRSLQGEPTRLTHAQASALQKSEVR